MRTKKEILRPDHKWNVWASTFSPWDSSAGPNNLFWVRKHPSNPHFSILNARAAHFKAQSIVVMMCPLLQAQAAGPFWPSRCQVQESEGSRSQLGVQHCAEHVWLSLPSLIPPRLALRKSLHSRKETGVFVTRCSDQSRGRGYLGSWVTYTFLSQLPSPGFRSQHGGPLSEAACFMEVMSTRTPPPQLLSIIAPHFTNRGTLTNTFNY